MSAGDLCTLADVRARMQKKGADVTQDALIASFIGPASAAIMRWTEREFAPQTNAVARVFEWPRDATLLSLAPHDVRVVTSVTVDTDVGVVPITLSADEWRLYPKPNRDGVSHSIRLRPFGVNVGRVAWENREVTITGDWGFPTIPVEAVQATAATVVHWMSTNVAAFRAPDEAGADPPKRGLPLEAKQMVNHYKRVG